MIVKNGLDEYFKLMKERPELFLSSDVISIVKDRGELEEYSETSGVDLGVVYKSNFNLLVVDLVESGGKRFPYERVISARDGRGVICVPVYKGKLLLLDQYRHATRSRQLSFPRGFGENGLSSLENAKKELWEEIGASCDKLLKLGELTPDSGLTSALCDVYLCHVDAFINNHEEGIIDIVCLSLSEVKSLIASGEIVDGFTLSAISLLDAKKIDLAL